MAVPEAGTDPGDLDLSIPRGMAQILDFEIINPDDSPFLLTGYRARMAVKRATSGGLPTGNALLSFSSEGASPKMSFITGEGGALNVVRVLIADEDADQLPVMLPGPPDRRGVWDIVLESAAGDESIRLQGRVRTRWKVAE